MTGEEMERAIEFLLEGQARLDNLIEQTNAQLALYAETQSQFIEIITRSIDTLTLALARTNERLTQSQTRTDERLAQTDERLMQAQARSDERIAQMNARTDERINALINVVERHIADGHGHQG